jgi:hypothetical protein
MADQEPEKMNIDDAVATLINELPAPVREFLQGPDRDRIALELTQKYRLHADQADIFQQGYLFLLLGVNTPEEFMEKLRANGISEEAIGGLLKDVNEMVFVPLRKKETEQTATPVAQPAPRASTPPPMKPPPPPDIPSISPPAAIPQPPMSVPSSVSVPKPPPAAVVAPKTVSTPAPQIPHNPDHPTMRTMATDMQEAKAHHMPEALFSRPAPVSGPPSASIRVVTPPPMPPPPTRQADIPAPPSPRASPPPNLPGTPLEKQYGTDPYHEPIE